MMGKISLIFFSLLMCIHLNAQHKNYIIEGKVEDVNGKTIPSVHIFLHETSQGCISDANGRYSIESVKSGHYHIHLSFIGFKSISKDIHVHHDTVINFVMEEAIFEMDEVILELDGLKKEQERTSLAVQIMDESKVEENNNLDFGRLIESQAGVNSYSVLPGVSRPIIRGMGVTRIIVSDNDIIQQGQSWGDEHGLEIDPDMIDRIEIVKGPASLLYGSGAIGGAINIKSYSIPELNTVNLKVKSKLNSSNYLSDQALSYAINSKGKIFNFKYSRVAYSDQVLAADSFTYINTTYPLYDQRLKNTAGQQSSFSTALGLSKHWGKTILQYSLYDQQMGFFPGAHEGRPREEDLQHDGDYRNWEIFYQDVQHHKLLSNSSILFKDHWLELNFAYQKNLRREMEYNDTALNLILTDYQAKAVYHYNKNEEKHWTFGMSQNYQFNQTGGIEFLIKPYEWYNGGYFALLEKEANRGVWNMGLRIDQHFIEIDDEREWFLNWSADIGKHIEYKKDHRIRWNIGRSYRVPNIAELSSDGVHHGTYRYERGDRELEAEHAYQFDLGWTATKKKIKYSVEPYAAYFSNLIYLSPSSMFVPVSLGGGQLYEYKSTQSFLSGVDVSLDMHLIEGIHIGLVADYTYHINLLNTLGIPLTPPMKVLQDIRFELMEDSKKWKHTYFYIENKWNAAQNRVDRNEWTTPSFYNMNIGLKGKYLFLKRNQMQFGFGVNNLFDSNYFSHMSLNRRLNLPEPGRHYFLSIKFALNAKLHVESKHKTDVHEHDHEE